MGRTVNAPFETGKECLLRVLGHYFLVHIRQVSDDTLWVSFPGADYPVEGIGADLEFHDPEGYICYHTQVVIGPKKKGDGVVLRRSGAANYLQHRRSWRVPTELPARVTPHDGGLEDAARVVDLSAEGALIEIKSILEIGSLISVCFTLLEEATYTVSAQVIYGNSEKTKDCYRFGLRFTEVSKNAQRALTLFLWKRIRTFYPNRLAALWQKTAQPFKPGATALHE